MSSSQDAQALFDRVTIGNDRFKGHFGTAGPRRFGL